MKTITLSQSIKFDILDERDGCLIKYKDNYYLFRWDDYIQVPTEDRKTYFLIPKLRSVLLWDIEKDEEKQEIELKDFPHLITEYIEYKYTKEVYADDLKDDQRDDLGFGV